MEGKNTGSPARAVALEVLIACEKRRAWSDSALSASIQRAWLSGRDAALTSRLCYGVQQNRLLLLYWLERICRVPVERLELPIRLILEMGLYQLAFLDRIPAHAAVDESVRLARTQSKNPRSPGLVNGVLRSFLRQRDTIPAPESLSVRYSHPQWLVDLLRGEVPEGTLEALLQADNSQPATVIQVNTLKTDGETLVRCLEGEGVIVEPHPFLSDCYQLSGTGDLSHLPSFREGLFQVQDAAARLAVLAAGPQPGMSVLDACAAPGGKSFQAAMEMKNRGAILSCDLQAKKLSRIREGAERLGIDCITTRVMDGRAFQPELEEKFDLVLVDVPCSGLGIIRKKPDIRYKEPEPLERLPEIQRAILDNVSRYVATGGALLYSTCTVLRRENQEVVSAFLSGHPGFHLESFDLPGVGECNGTQTLWPHLHGTDGFFMAKLRRET